MSNSLIDQTSDVDWSDGDLQFGLEEVDKAENSPDEGYRPQGVDDEFAAGLLQELRRRGWAEVDWPTNGDDQLVPARLTQIGRRELSAWRQADRLPRDQMPGSPAEAWSKLRADAEPFSPLARSIDDAEARLHERGMYQSRPSIVGAMEVAYDHGLTWAPDERAFVQRDRPALASPPAMPTPTTPDPRKVFVVHGRDLEARIALFDFLKALGLDPLEWEEVVALTGLGTPFVADVVDRGFEEAAAAVVLLTPDDEVRLHQDLRDEEEPEFETQLTCQPRPNVLIEAGMALARGRDRTIIVQLGDVRPASDLGGMNLVHLGKTGALRALAQRLRTAGCPADLTTSAIANDRDFKNLSAQRRQPVPGSVSSDGESRPPTLEEMAVGFDLSYDPVNPDPKRPETARLLITYNGRLSCEEVKVEELRDPRWSTAVLRIERHEPHTSSTGYTTDVLRHLDPGDTRPFVVLMDPEGRAGEIRMRFTPTIGGREYPPVVASCPVEPVKVPRVRWLDSQAE